MWNKIVENIRQERVTEFAPPQTYQTNKKTKKKKQTENSEDVKTKESKIEKNFNKIRKGKKYFPDG